MEFHERLKKVMKDAGVKNKDLMKACNVSSGAVSQWRNGDVKPKNIICIAKKCGWDATELENYLNTGREPTKVNESPGLYESTKIISWDNQSDLPENTYVFIPRYNVHVSAGNGSIAWDEIEKEQPQAFRNEFITNGGFKADALKVIYARGDSMEPRIYNGDSITIDTLQTSVINEKYYVIRIEDEIMVKKLRKRPGGGLEIISLNQAYAPMSLTAEETNHINIIGRVIQISSMGDL